jgi:hypothetical protein
MKIKRLGLTVEDITNMLTLTRIKLNNEWNRNVPVIPGDPKYLNEELVIPKEPQRDLL